MISQEHALKMQAAIIAVCLERYRGYKRKNKMNRIKELVPEEDYKKLVKEFGPLAEFVAIHQNPDYTLRAVIRFEISTSMPHSDTVPYASANYPVYKNLLKKIKTEIVQTTLLHERKKKQILKRKDELKADQGLEQLGIKPRIYLFEENIKPFTAITIAEDRLTWAGVRRELNNIIPRIDIHPHGKATRLREELRRIDIYGVGIGDSREPNKNRRLGRTIAKGRLLKHLKKTGVRKR